MNKMFCFQCEQTAKCTGCTQIGVCGKTAEVSNLQDELTSSLIKLANTLPQTEENPAHTLQLALPHPPPSQSRFLRCPPQRTSLRP